jgi:dGTPase
VGGAGRDEPDQERFVDEGSKDSGSARSPYARDRARVLHSAAFRRLAAKTQVHTQAHGGATVGADVLRTRLTHSLEVAQIAREMGASLGCDPDVVDTAGLAHDLGHPPFGHNGEDALDQVAQACGGFEGNAQTLRVLTRLEAKVTAPGGGSAGLNLTRACLDASCKYPWPRRSGERKFGVYADDAPVFGWLRAGSAGDRRCLEAQVMDWADDVAYSVHDVEDGIIAGYVRLDLLVKDQDERKGLCGDAAEVYSGESAVDLGAELAGLLADPAVAAVTDFDGTSGSYVRLKRLASVLIGRFVSAAVRATRDAYGHDPLSRYGADLIVPRPVRAQCALLKAIALRYVMRRPGSAGRYAQEQSILRELVAQLAERAPDALDPVFSPLWLAADGDAARLRVVVDQVASLTDPAAIAWHRSLTG